MALRSFHTWLLSVACLIGVALLGPSPLGGVHDPASKLDDAVILPLCALVDQGFYLEAESLALELLPQVEKEWGEGSLETAEILDILTEARWRGGNATDTATVEAADRALTIRQRRLGYDHPIVADSLVEKANVLHERAEPSEAEKLLELAQAVYSRAYGRGDSHVAVVLNNLGNLYYDTGELERSRQSLEKAIELFEALCGTDCVQLVGSLGSLAGTLEAQGHYKEAEGLLRRELAICEAAGGLDNPRAIGTIHGLGFNLQQQGKYLEARVVMRRAIRAKEEVLRAEHPSQAASILNLAILESDLGHFDEAEKSYQAGISIFEESLGPSHPDTARAWINYGALQEDRDLVVARSQYERALETFRSIYGEQHYLTAWSETSLARALRRLGDWQGAARHLDKANDYWRENDSPIALHIGTLAETGELELTRGNLDGARSYFEQALELEFESHGADHPHIAGMQTRIGEVLVRQGAYDEAEERLQLALRIAERAPGSESPAYATVLTRMGDLKFARKEWAEALGYYRRALTILEIVYAGPTSESAELRLKIARCLSELGSRRPAAVAALQAEDVSRAHLRLMLTGMPESEGLRFAGSRSTGLDLAFSLVVSGADDDLEEAAVDSLIRSRALVLDEMAGRWRGLNLQHDPAIEAMVKELASTRKRLAYLVVRGPEDPKRMARYTSLLQVAREEREHAERDLVIASRAHRLQGNRHRVGLEQVVAALPPNSVLVGFARIKIVDLEREPDRESGAGEGEPSYVAYLVGDQETVPEVILLGYASEIDDLIQRTQGHIIEQTDSVGVGEAWSESVYRRDAELLQRRIWDPIADRLGDPERIFIVPDGALHLINFSALPVGESEYLIDRGPQLHYLSAERDLVSGDPVSVGQGLLALGNPNFDQGALISPVSGVSVGAPTSTRSSRSVGRGACENFQSMKFKAIPGADAELNQVISSWNENQGTDRGSTDLRGIRASEAAFKSESPGKRVVHLATHGFFLGERCPTEISLNPLLRSGLALAGANLRGVASSDQDDGILTAEEIVALDLDGVEWAVLSACESGLGEIRAGEGVLGLRRAFSIAGVRTLIMSLWQVDDEPTLEWMSLLYQHRFVDGLETVDAVHQANLDLLNARRAAGLSTHPFYWAGFVAAGDWR